MTNTMKNLTIAEQTNLIAECMGNDGMDRSKTARMNAFKEAAEKFGLKVTRFKPNTYFEEVILHTNYDNYDEVREYISSLGVSVIADCGKLTFKPNI